MADSDRPTPKFGSLKTYPELLVFMARITNKMHRGEIELDKGKACIYDASSMAAIIKTQKELAIEDDLRAIKAALNI
jgi:hypothetical protein